MAELYEKLGELYKLQQIDSEIINSLRTIRHHERTETPIQKKYREMSEKKKEIETQSAPVKAEIRQFQDEVAAFTEKKKACEDKLFSAGTEPKELQFLQKEREQYINLIKVREDRLIKLMIQMDGAEIKRKDLEQRLKEIEPEYRKEQDKVEAEVKQLKERVETLKQARKDFRNFEDRELLEMYQQVQREGDGVAIVSVTNEGACEGCYVEVSKNTINQLSNCDGIVTCPRCGRILYI
ncbi:MAG: C4-type zinc ribbon domain-containing protein, partial [bacterium]